MERSYSDYFVKMVLGQYPKNNFYRSLGWSLGLVIIVLFPLGMFFRILPGIVKVIASNKIYPTKKMVKKIVKHKLHWVLSFLFNLVIYTPIIENSTKIDLLSTYLYAFAMTLILTFVLFICICGKYISLLNK